jgi:hypothetical protein
MGRVTSERNSTGISSPDQFRLIGEIKVCTQKDCKSYWHETVMCSKIKKSL